MAGLPFINNSIFVDYLHSTDVVQHFHLNLPKSRRLCQPPRWCDMAPPSWALAFPMMGSLQYLLLFLTPSHLMLMALPSHLYHTLVQVYADNTLVKPWLLLFVHQPNLNFSPITDYYCLGWTSLSLVLETQTLKGSRPRTHMSLKRVFPRLTDEAWFDMSKEHVVALPPIYPLLHLTSY